MSGKDVWRHRRTMKKRFRAGNSGVLLFFSRQTKAPSIKPGAFLASGRLVGPACVGTTAIRSLGINIIAWASKPSLGRWWPHQPRRKSYQRCRSCGVMPLRRLPPPPQIRLSPHDMACDPPPKAQKQRRTEKRNEHHMTLSSEREATHFPLLTKFISLFRNKAEPI